MRIKLQLFLIVSSLLLSVAWTSSPVKGDYVLYVFEGSDWCHNCIRLDKNVLSTTAFKEFTKEEEIIVEHIDFPQRKKLDKKTAAYNASIAEKYNFQGIFPTLILVHTESGKASIVKYANENVAAFIATIEIEKTELR